MKIRQNNNNDNDNDKKIKEKAEIGELNAFHRLSDKFIEGWYHL